jgi:hypothetical protein
LQDFNQDDDCSQSILVSEEQNSRSEGQDWPSRIEGICFWARCVYRDNIDYLGFSSISEALRATLKTQKSIEENKNLPSFCPLVYI